MEALWGIVDNEREGGREGEENSFMLLYNQGGNQGKENNGMTN